ncbi:MAG: oligoendopeptidase F, partial [Calditrichia bacterium]|nr:oligoendopeptidase F [Calditrichia bacterium]
MKILKQISLFLFILLTFQSVAIADLPKTREEIDPQYKWKVSDIYPDWESWQNGLAQLEILMDSMTVFKGTLAQGPDQLFRALKLDEDINILIYRVYQYPRFQWDLDTRNQEISGKVKQVQLLFAKFQTATAWIQPEMLQIPWETMAKWLDDIPELTPYRFSIEDLYRQQAHVLDEDKEKLLSYFSQLKR